MTVPAVHLTQYYDPSIAIAVRQHNGSLYNQAADSEAVYRWIAANAIEGNVAPRSGRLRYLRLIVPVDRAIGILTSVSTSSALERALGSLTGDASRTIIRQREIGPLVFAHKINVLQGVA